MNDYMCICAYVYTYTYTYIHVQITYTCACVSVYACGLCIRVVSSGPYIIQEAKHSLTLMPFNSEQQPLNLLDASAQYLGVAPDIAGLLLRNLQFELP